jgi:hypothetical protein
LKWNNKSSESTNLVLVHELNVVLVNRDVGNAGGLHTEDEQRARDDVACNEEPQEHLIGFTGRKAYHRLFGKPALKGRRMM